MAVARARSVSTSQRVRKGRERLPVIEVDVDDEEALSAVAEQVAAALMSGAAGRPEREAPKPAGRGKSAGRSAKGTPRAKSNATKTATNDRAVTGPKARGAGRSRRQS